MIFVQHYLKYDDTDFSLEIAPIARVTAIKAKGSANYGPPCSGCINSVFAAKILDQTRCSNVLNVREMKCQGLNRVRQLAYHHPKVFGVQLHSVTLAVTSEAR